MSWYEFRPYVSVAERRRNAEREMAALAKKGKPVSPVIIAGREIAKSFWGKSWCRNLEGYSDFASRLPRGRSYVRNGSVVNLQIAKGEIVAHVAGSALYTVTIGVKPVAAKQWKAICGDCAGSVGSLVELLQGRLAHSVMERVCRRGDGLFPAPEEISLACSCPDWAAMCKHVAAVLYGVGARLDESPQSLFLLRNVNEGELLADVGPDLTLKHSAPTTARRLEDQDLAALFGLDMADTGASIQASDKHKKRSRPSRKPGGKRTSKRPTMRKTRT